MPFIVPFIPLIAAGIGAGTTIAGIVDRPSGQQATVTPPTPTTPQAVESTTLTGAQKTLASQTGANVSDNTSGFASPDYLQSVITQALGANAGQQGSVQGLVNNVFGIGGTPPSGLASGVPGTSSGVVDSLLNQSFSGFA